MANASRNMISWRTLACEELEAKLCFSKLVFAPHEIVLNEADGASSVYAADLDGDGDQDVLSASRADDKIAWYENTDGEGSYGPQRVITTEADVAESVYAADLDDDGDVDVLSASWQDNKIAWYENTDGAGTFGPQRVITTDSRWATSVHATDVDGDGDLDVLSASHGDNKIAWYENTDGAGTFGPQQIIDSSVTWAKSVYTADLDGDGDPDVLSASWALSGNQIFWYENTDGAGTFGPQTAITSSASGARSVYAADLDGDGDADVLSASHWDNKIAWYENTDGAGTFGPQQVLTRDARWARSVSALDIDGDGDLDVLSASNGDGKIAWYENTNGRGTFGPPQIVSGDADLVESAVGADVNGDGEVDVVSAAGDDKVVWHEQSRAAAGDVNLDCRFDQQDILQVLLAGKFRSGESAVWEEGDFTGDGSFDALDIVAALQTGNYLQAPYCEGDSVFGETEG